MKRQPADQQRVERKPAIALRGEDHDRVEPGREMAVEPDEKVGIELVDDLAHGSAKIGKEGKRQRLSISVGATELIARR